MKRSAFFICSLLLMMITGMYACKKSSTGSGQFMVVNASPGLAGTDVVIDGARFNSSVLSFPSNTGYKPLPEGSHVLSIKDAAGSTSYVDVNFSSAPNAQQSLYVFDRPSSLQVFAVVDNLPATGSGKSGLRFFHLAPGTTAVDLGILSGAVFSSLFSARTFETSTTAATNAGFTLVNSGTFSFDVRVNGPGVSILTVNNVVLQEGKSYTLFLKGINGSGTTPLGLELITHN